MISVLGRQVFDKQSLSRVALIAIVFSCYAVIGATAIAKAEGSKQDELVVTSSEFNRASSLLFQWWGLFEGPDDADVSAYFDKVFSQDVHLTFGETDINGIEALRAVYKSLPAGIDSAHHVEEIRVLKIAPDDYRLEADFVYQTRVRPEDATANRLQYHHKIEKTADGNFTLLDVSSTPIESLDIPTFEPTYTENRVRAALLQYLGAIDVMDSDYTELASVIDSATEIHGMFDPADVSFNTRGDGILKGRKEISAWLATRKNTYSAVAHRLTEVEVISQKDNYVDARIAVSTQAWPITGDRIKVDGIFAVVLRDTGEQFMVIEQIRR